MMRENSGSAVDRSPTARLILGTAGFDLGKSRTSHIRVLETAWDNGITHFDTAPVYAHGQAERILGEFLRRRTALITTKCGLSCKEFPRMSPWLFRAARSILRNCSRRQQSTPGDRKAETTAVTGNGVLPRRLQPEVIRKSIDRSLDKLGVAKVSTILLHEASASQANAPELIDFFASLHRQAILQECGIAGTASCDLSSRDLRRPYTIHQSCFHLGYDRPPHGEDSPIKFYAYSALQPLRALSEALYDGVVRKRWQATLDSSLVGEASLAVWLVAWCLAQVNVSKVVFFSSKPEHVCNIARGVNQLHDDQARMRLFEDLAVRALGR
jgi:D-threo-aldose 1-dehydrogenase